MPDRILIPVLRNVFYLFDGVFAHGKLKHIVNTGWNKNVL